MMRLNGKMAVAVTKSNDCVNTLKRKMIHCCKMIPTRSVWKVIVVVERLYSYTLRGMTRAQVFKGRAFCIRLCSYTPRGMPRANVKGAGKEINLLPQELSR